MRAQYQRDNTLRCLVRPSAVSVYDVVTASQHFTKCTVQARNV